MISSNVIKYDKVFYIELIDMLEDTEYDVIEELEKISKSYEVSKIIPLKRNGTTVKLLVFAQKIITGVN